MIMMGSGRLAIRHKGLGDWRGELQFCQHICEPVSKKNQLLHDHRSEMAALSSPSSSNPWVSTLRRVFEMLQRWVGMCPRFMLAVHAVHVCLKLAPIKVQSSYRSHVAKPDRQP